MLDGEGWRGYDGFQDFENEAGDGENVARRVIATVRVGVLGEDDVLVAMHDPYPPMIAIDTQLSRGEAAAGKLETRQTTSCWGFCHRRSS